MMRRIRLFPAVIFVLFLTFTVRLGDFFVQLVTTHTATLQSSEAFANEAAPKAEKAEGGEHGKKPEAKKGEEKAERQEIPPKSDEVAKEVEVKGIEKDPFASDYSEEEVKVLQDLSKRREQLEQRERDLDQREKLLQAAEKKVDEKIAEMDKLKQGIEQLLDKQQKVQDESMAQLVKIYENMKPKDAANIFNEMEGDVLLGIIDRMSERKVAPILAAMDPARAREVSFRLAEQRALPKPTAAPAQ